MTESTSSGDPDKVREVPEIDTTVAQVARVYDYLLGGETNFAVDREAAHASHANVPGGVQTSMTYVQANRRFLGRAVRYLASEAGIRQFLDLGSGIPTEDNVHQVAQRVVPESRIVYVDDDPIVLAHSHELMESTPEGIAQFVPRDLRDTEAVLAETATHDQVARFFDGLELVEPGLVMVDQWRPDPGQPDTDAPFHGGVARKP